jgi:hypothetical protein
MSRFWRNGSAVMVTFDGELPATFVWKGRAHSVQQITRRWQVDVEWWRFRVWREYFRLTTDTGLLVVLYHDLINDTWHIQRVYD